MAEGGESFFKSLVHKVVKPVRNADGTMTRRVPNRNVSDAIIDKADRFNRRIGSTKLGEWFGFGGEDDLSTEDSGGNPIKQNDIVDERGIGKFVRAPSNLKTGAPADNQPPTVYDGWVDETPPPGVTKLIPKDKR